MSRRLNMRGMKFNAKQLDNTARLLGTLCASSTIGFMVSISRPESVTKLEQHGLITAAVGAFCAMLLILKD